MRRNQLFVIVLLLKMLWQELLMKRRNMKQSKTEESNKLIFFCILVLILSLSLYVACCQCMMSYVTIHCLVQFIEFICALHNATLISTRCFLTSNLIHTCTLIVYEYRKSKQCMLHVFL